MEYDKFLAAILWTKAEWGKRKPKRESGCQKYQDFSYVALRARGNNYWLHLEKMNKAKLEKEIIDCFLNTRRWFCYLDPPGTPRRQRMVCNLKKAVDKLPDFYAALKGFGLEDMHFGKCNLWLIDQVYSIFRQIEPKFGAVPASKLMHMALPNLFMMWDGAIIKEYGVKKQGLPGFGRRVWSYTAFLMLMQENIRHIKETNPRGSSVTNQELFQQINGRCGYDNLPITRLLDIANYAVSRKGSGIKCSKCIKATNSKLKAMKWYDERYKPKKPFLDC